ncbi:Gp138 family membrane-puncturing spike protein [Xanthobacter agilis]|uniref:Phage protein Gp138 N-terminal domain-containing protein n=1 Tax=Xanthobacter agilis TaxID=47492 RepID=A0ABU0LJV9_XANAG|nr:Gp138 family membrane-puncturing spike protein [Xanthobacter agilis]MDQ0507425.1 hypothetical protein [Xanthobacter agilis]
MDSRTRYEDIREAVETIVESRLAELHTAEPCTIVKMNWETQTADLQPTTKSIIRKPDGTTEWIFKPVIPDVKVHFPSGGGLSLTFPLKEGDEVLAVMASRSPDVWQQNGGEQQIIDTRMHDLSNAFCIPGFRSDKNALSDVSETSTQLRSDDGKTVFDFKSGTASLTVEDASVTITTESATLQKGDLKVIVTSSKVQLGGEGGSPVLTQAGPSTKVYAVI